MAVPILHKDEVLGVIVIESSKKIGAFTKKDLLLIMNIANHTAQFIKNSLLHEELKTQEILENFHFPKMLKNVSPPGRRNSRKRNGDSL